MMSSRSASMWIAAATWVPLLILAVLALTLEPDPDRIVTALLVLALIPTVIFFLRYGRVRWWKYREGRNMIGITGLLASIIVEELIVRFAGRPDWHPHFLIGALVLLIGLMWQRVLMFIIAREDAISEQRKITDEQAARGK